MNLNLNRTEDTFDRQRKQFNRIRWMNIGWLERHPPHVETLAVWAVTAFIVLINLDDFFSEQIRPVLLTAGLASVVLSGVLWLRWRNKPHNWADLIADELVSYLPTDPDAFARLQQSVLKDGQLDPKVLDEWVKAEECAIQYKEQALNRREFAFTSRKMGHETEDRHHDDARHP
ncbi:hypothetical protein [Pantoea ananatis]